MTNLSVNINKIATLRNARGGNTPNVEQVAIDCQRFGADGITVHPRPDERHIRYADVVALRSIVNTEFNIEGYPSDEFMKLVLMVKPEQVTLVPDAPDVLTSSCGWNVEHNMKFLTAIVERLKDAGIRTSIFVGTDLHNIEQAAQTGADRIELYTGPFAHNYNASPDDAVAPFALAADKAHACGLGVNAGHDLSLENLHFFSNAVKHLEEVSIGHALISDALYLGLHNTITEYKKCLGR